MLRIAWKMVIGDRAKFIGILIGLGFAALLITQQAGIYKGLMARTYGFITDTGLPDLWVMDPEVQHADDIINLQETELLRVRGVQGVDWALPMFKGIVRARLPDGNAQTVMVVGLDDATLVGGPPNIVQGNLEGLKQRDAVIIDLYEAENKLVVQHPGESERTLMRVGDEMELNDQRAVVVGLARNSPTFQSAPVVYTTYSRALEYAPRERKSLSFMLVKVKEGADIQAVANRIFAQTGLKALTKQQFEQATYDFYYKNTGIPINFGTAVVLGFIVGTAIAGQTFYNFTLDNLRFFGTFKAMGASNGRVIAMIVWQALFLGLLGYGLGVGSAATLGVLLALGNLAFKIDASLLIFTAIAILCICMGAAIISSWRVVRLEPAIVFRS